MKVFKLFRKVRGKDEWVRNPKLVAAEKAIENAIRLEVVGEAGPLVTEIVPKFKKS